MKFLVDAQLPRRLARWLQAEGHEATQTRDLPAGNRTIDATINELSVREQRVVITKDEDFVDTFLLRHQPYKLLLVAPAISAIGSWSGCFRTTSNVLSRHLRHAISSSSIGQPSSVTCKVA
jgi:predicted nuclease of predicted toxin-antitoxin system